jgi:hypothetical protein
VIKVDCLHKSLYDLEFLKKYSENSTVITVDCLHKILDDLEFLKK